MFINTDNPVLVGVATSDEEHESWYYALSHFIQAKRQVQSLFGGFGPFYRANPDGFTLMASMMLLKALWILIPRVVRGTLNLLGFKPEGVERDSYAARYQSYTYGSFVPDDSWFAASQSRAAVAEEDGNNVIVTAHGVVLLVVSITILLTATK